jgi:hypothetical protein
MLIFFAGFKYVEEVFGSILAWNSSLYEPVLILRNISILNLALTVCRVDIPVWAVCLGCNILYGQVSSVFS